MLPNMLCFGVASSILSCPSELLSYFYLQHNSQQWSMFIFVLSVLKHIMLYQVQKQYNHR